MDSNVPHAMSTRSSSIHLIILIALIVVVILVKVVTRKAGEAIAERVSTSAPAKGRP